MGILRRMLGIGGDRVDPEREAAKTAEVDDVLSRSDSALAEKERVVAAQRDRVNDEFKRAEDAMRLKPSAKPR